MGSALLDSPPRDLAFAEASGDSPAAATQPHAAARGTARAASTEALRRQVAERLAAHRARRPNAQPALALSPASSPSAPVRTSRIAAAVAQRYAHSPSYRAYLAAEAERATQQARAAAQIAALNAQAVAQAQQQLLDSLNQESFNQESLNHGSFNHEARDRDPSDHQSLNQSPVQLPHELSLWPEAQPPRAPHTRSATSPGAPSSTAASSSPKLGSTESHEHHTCANSQPFAPALPGLTVRLFDDDAEARRLDEEIAFRQSPVFEEPTGPPMPLPANLIEFPRQLVAPRKARPRYAEGPLCATTGGSQLRIFEVDPAQISTTPVPAEASVPKWTSIWLDAPGPGPTETAAVGGFELDLSTLDLFATNLPASGLLAGSSARTAPLPQIASIARRVMAAAIDASILLAAFLAFTAAILLAACRSIPWYAAASLPAASLPLGHRPGLARMAAQFTAHTGLQPSLALAAGALVLALFCLLYQALFFSFSEATPGMRCARIALCTFDGENPTRRAMRRRILAVLVSACPLGLGLFWATLDEDRLAWHDRLTRTYQRSY